MSFPIMGIAPFSALYADPTTTAKGTIGSLAMDPMGGLWRYIRAGAALGTSNTLLGCGSYSQPTDVTAGATSVGSWTIACSGSSDATCVKDQYANGTIIIGGSTATLRRFYHIKGNTASTTTTTTLTLHQPVTYALAGTEWATIATNRFYDVRQIDAAGGYMSVCCMPLRAVDSGSYCWAKVRGETFGVVSSTVPGAASGDRMVVFQASDGALIMADESWGKSTPDSQQLAGWIIPRTGGDYAAGDQTFWLQIE